MKAPIKPGTEASKTREGGALGNIDEAAGHPDKGSTGPALNPEHSGSDAKPKEPARKPKA
jgi:hypothetical protein